MKKNQLLLLVLLTSNTLLTVDSLAYADPASIKNIEKLENKDSNSAIKETVKTALAMAVGSTSAYIGGRTATGFISFGIETAKPRQMNVHNISLLALSIYGTGAVHILKNILNIHSTCHDLVSKKYSTQEMSVKLACSVGFFCGIKDILKLLIQELKNRR